MKLSSAAESIRSAMAPDPAAWSFTGEVCDYRRYDAAKCTCGHAVRYLFFIVRVADGKRLGIGSDCIRESVPLLMADGAVRLARDLRQAERDRRASWRLEEAAEALPELRGDFEKLRAWCWRRRHEWTERYGPEAWKPPVLYVPPKLPAAAERDDKSAEAIRRKYTSGWLKAATCAVEEGFEVLPPSPRNVRLYEQLKRRNRNVLGNRGHRDHEIMCRIHAAYEAQRNRKAAAGRDP